MERFHGTIVFICVMIGLININIVNSAFPSDPKPCAFGDTECLTKVINYFLHDKSNGGDSSINLVPIDPLKVSEIGIKQGAESPVNIDVVYTNNDLTGLKTAKVQKLKGFGKDLTEKHEIHLKVERASLIGDYKIKGRILLLPITGSGKANMTTTNTDMILSFSGTPVEKNGEKYMKIKNMAIDYKPGRMYYDFENLFNGDKELSDNMNLFLNENWREIYGEIKISLQDAFSKVFESVLNTVFDKLPYAKFFSE